MTKRHPPNAIKHWKRNFLISWTSVLEMIERELRQGRWYFARAWILVILNHVLEIFVRCEFILTNFLISSIIYSWFVDLTCKNFTFFVQSFTRNDFVISFKLFQRVLTFVFTIVTLEQRNSWKRVGYKIELKGWSEKGGYWQDIEEWNGEN